MTSLAVATFVHKSLLKLAETQYSNHHISRSSYLSLINELRKPSFVASIAAGLYGPKREAIVGMPEFKIVRLSLREFGRRKSSLLVFQGLDRGANANRRSLRCLVGHRFTAEIKHTFRWNLRELFGLFRIEADYSDFDGRAVNLIDDLSDKIRSHDFCLFDNRETTNPSRPNVYIEAGMAFALHRPFIFAHYAGEIWPTDFSNVLYIPYRNYRELFRNSTRASRSS